MTSNLEDNSALMILWWIFVCFEKRIIVEVDGGQHAVELEKDTERTDYLNRNGFRVVRFWNNEVLGNIEGVLDVIRRNCE